MHFSDLFHPERKTLSFEFFPPRREQTLAGTLSMISDLSTLKPDFMTVTYGAGGGTRALTRRMVGFIHNELQTPAVAHLTCVGHTRDELAEIVDGFVSDGIDCILALRGDPPKGQASFEAHPEGLSNARELTAFIKSRADINVIVAGYPEAHRDALSPEDDLSYLKSKVEAGADAIITQLFFDPAHYFSFVDRARSAGIAVPIVPGIMPISNVEQLTRFTTMCGASIPKDLRCKLDSLDAESVTAFGIDHAVELIETLFGGGAPGLHLYTLNKSSQARPVVEALQAYFRR